MIELLIRLVVAILACYGVTEIITASYAAKWFREVYRDVVWEIFPRFLGKHFVRWYVGKDGQEDEAIITDEEHTTYDGREVKGYDMIACSICVGFWVSSLVAVAFGIGTWSLAVYGGTVFMNRQER